MTRSKRVVLEGCNGSWSQRRYLPFLTEKAAKGEIELWAVDIEQRIRLSDPRVADLWRTAESRGKVHYLNKTQNERAYEDLSGVTHVFVVTPPSTHLEIAGSWLERLSPGGAIFVEKPLDTSVQRAGDLKEKLGGRGVVYGFDHYLARARPFLQRKTEYLGKIGQIYEIEFYILEPRGFPLNEAATLNKGVIFDLFIHVLALIDAVLDSELSLKTVELEDVKAARYPPASRETFAWIKFRVGGVEVESAVGKSVGSSDEKFMKIHGSNGQVKLDFSADRFFIFDKRGDVIGDGDLNSNHVESFLEEILRGKDPLSAPGVLSFNVAFDYLMILDKIEGLVGKMPEYQPGESLSEILRRL